MMQLAKSSTNPLKRCFQTMMMNHEQPKLFENRTEVENVTAPFVPHKYSFYQPSKVDHVDLKVKLESSRFKFEVQLLEMQISLQNNHKDSNEKHEILRKRLSNDHSIIISCVDELGLLCVFEAVKFCIANTLQAVEEECDFFQESCLKCFYFLKDALCIVEKCLPNGHENIFDAGCDYEKMVAAGYISPKIYQLFYLFQSFGEATKVLCLIFVENVITAKVLDIIVKRVEDLSHLEVTYLTSEGTSVDAMSPKLQKETLESLCSGKVNLLFATDVVDEGVDMSKCSTVICFDIPKTARSNVQSRGWACQSASQFITMLERGNAKQREHICDIIQSKHSMLDSPQRQDPDTSVVDPKNFKETKLHYPGELMDLRSASVNNENFAYTAVRRDIHLHLQHHSSYLQGQIEDYVQFVASSSTDTKSLQTKKKPKGTFTVLEALGDLVESIAGAILVDAKLDLDDVWRIVEPLLSPIVTPDKLKLPPLRESMEWCDLMGYFTKEEYRPNGEDVTGELGLQLKDALLIGEGTGSTRKIARGQAALKLLRELEKRGMLKKTQREYNKDMEIDNQDNNKDQGNRDGETAKQNSKDQENIEGEADNQNSKDQESRDGETVKQKNKDQENREEGETDNQNNIVSETTPKKPDSNRNTNITLFDPQPSTNASIVDECSMKEAPKSKLEIPVLMSINMKKGGPRSSLFELCQKMQWPMPSFTSTEQKSTSIMEIGEGGNKRTAFNSYESLISLTIPGYCVVELTGHACVDKKSSYDSAALLMLYELQKLGKLKVG